MTNDATQYTPPYPLIIEGLNRGLVIPFLGAGASLNRSLTGQTEIYIPTEIPISSW